MWNATDFFYQSTAVRVVEWQAEAMKKLLLGVQEQKKEKRTSMQKKV